MLNAYPEAITSQEISDQTGIERNKVQCALRRYSGPKYSFIGKLKGKTAEGYYRYRIHKCGVELYLELKHRVNLGFDLNRRNRVPKRLNSYLGITKQGSLELGVTEADLGSPEVDFDLAEVDSQIAEECSS